MQNPLTIADIKRRIARMEQLADRAESDGEYEACRQVLIGLNDKLQALQSSEQSGARFLRPARPDAARPVVLPFGGRAAPNTRAATPPSARNWANLPRLAPSYDATAERWIVPPAKSGSDLQAEIIDGLTTIAGLLVFGTVALFFLALA